MYIIYILILAIFWWPYLRLLFNSGFVNLSFFHFVYFFLFNYIGAVEIINAESSKNYVYLISVLGYPLVALLGILIANITHPVKLNKYTYVMRMSNSRVNLYLILTLLVILLYLISLPNIPVITALKGDVVAAAVQRSLSTKEYEGPKILFYSFRLIVEYLLIYFIVLFYIKKNKINITFLLIFSFAAIIDTQKYPLINFLALTFIGVYFINLKKDGRLKLKMLINVKMIIMLLLLYIFLGLLNSIASGRLIESVGIESVGVLLESANVMIYDRLIMGQNRPLYALYEMIPAKYDFFLGQTFPNPMKLLPFENVQLSYLVFDAVHGLDGIAGVRGSAPTVFFSFVYANFGLAMSAITMFLFGYGVQIINNKLEVTDVRLIPFRLVLMSYLAIFATSIDVFFMSEKFIFLLILFHLLYKRKSKHQIN